MPEEHEHEHHPLHHGAGETLGFLVHKIGPLPVWAYLLGIAGGLGLAWWISRHNSAAAEPLPSAPPSPPPDSGTGGGGTSGTDLQGITDILQTIAATLAQEEADIAKLSGGLNQSSPLPVSGGGGVSNNDLAAVAQQYGATLPPGDYLTQLQSLYKQTHGGKEWWESPNDFTNWSQAQGLHDVSAVASSFRSVFPRVREDIIQAYASSHGTFNAQDAQAWVEANYQGLGI